MVTVMAALDMLFDGPRSSASTLLLAHGAGAPMDSPFMAHIAVALGERGVRVARFEFPYMRERRDSGKKRPPDGEKKLRARWVEVIDTLGGADSLVIGGKSMGGRIASMMADEIGARGLVCLGYPFHAPGRADKPRTAHLADLQTTSLIVQGTRDALGSRTEVEGYSLSARIEVAWLEDGDHSFKPRKSSGRTEDQNLDQAVAAVHRFLQSLA